MLNTEIMLIENIRFIKGNLREQGVEASSCTGCGVSKNLVFNNMYPKQNYSLRVKRREGDFNGTKTYLKRFPLYL